MGDVADMMVDGTLDYETGEYLGEGQGYPRTARQRHRFSNKRHGETKGIRGIKKFLKIHLKMSTDVMHQFCADYINKYDLDPADANTLSWKQVHEVIDQDFDHFRQYVNNYSNT